MHLEPVELIGNTFQATNLMKKSNIKVMPHIYMDKEFRMELAYKLTEPLTASRYGQGTRVQLLHAWVAV